MEGSNLLTPKQKENRARALKAINRLGAALQPHNKNIIEILEQLADLGEQKPKKLLRGLNYL